MPDSIMIVGVGGQGTILAGNLLSKALISVGHTVKVSEIVGMSQRGGSVCTQIRYGSIVASPVIEKGACDHLLAFEKMEAVRYLEYLKADAKIIVNDLELYPMPVTIGKTPYPKGILEYLSGRRDTTVIAAAKAADELGSRKAINLVLLGALAKSLGLENLDWESVITESVKPEFVTVNLKALQKGMDLYSEAKRVRA